MLSISQTFNKLSNFGVLESGSGSIPTILFRTPPAVDDMKSRLRSYQDAYLYLNSELVEGAVPTTPQRLEHIQSVFSDWVYVHREVIAAVVDFMSSPPSISAEVALQVGLDDILGAGAEADFTNLSLAQSRISAISGLTLTLDLVKYSNISYAAGRMGYANSIHTTGEIRVEARTQVDGAAYAAPPLTNGLTSIIESHGSVNRPSSLVTVPLITESDLLHSDLTTFASFIQRSISPITVNASQNASVKYSFLRPHIKAVGLCLSLLSDIGIDYDVSPIPLSDFLEY